MSSAGKQKKWNSNYKAHKSTYLLHIELKDFIKSNDNNISILGFGDEDAPRANVVSLVNCIDKKRE